MKRQIKKQLLSLLDSMKNANKYIKLQIKNSNYEILSSLLSDCQAAAFEIGTAIEEAGEDQTGVVPMLEGYCETAYALNQAAENKEQAKKLAEVMENQLTQICHLIKTSVRETLEILFLPYKASMWDSLESIWLAANEDADCEAYVVPIPYYEKNKDGTQRIMRYEGGEFPDYVPIVDWQNYQLAERHPDIIYIHNPYDDGNFVTSIHPDYYSRELKKHTDMLVYIPYFIAMDDEVPKHFCVCAGTILADKVIVQSPNVRDIYIKQFQQFIKENHYEGRFGDLHEKFLALGSPKIDKVLSVKRESCNIPESWMQLIKKPDGSCKKIVLYNTGIDALLRHQGRMLEKILTVLQTFYQFKDDIVLLWRPHPLIEATIQSMLPELNEIYQKLVAAYRGEAWGIYDDTSDLNRAIAISDAYYGDRSSVAALYKATGKPVMIQNAYITDK